MERSQDFARLYGAVTCPVSVHRARSGRIVYCNDPMAVNYGVTAGEAHGRNCRDLRPDFAEQWAARGHRGAAKGRVDDLCQLDGRWYRRAITPIPRGLVVVALEDVTAAMQLAASRLLTGSRASECRRADPDIAGLVYGGASIKGVCAALNVTPAKVWYTLAKLAGIT